MQGDGLRLKIGQFSRNLHIEFLGGITALCTIKAQQRLPLKPRVSDRAVGLQNALEGNVKGLIERDPTGIELHAGNTPGMAVFRINKMNLAIFQLQPCDIDVHLRNARRQQTIGGLSRRIAGRAGHAPR